MYLGVHLSLTETQITHHLNISLILYVGIVGSAFSSDLALRKGSCILIDKNGPRTICDEGVDFDLILTVKYLVPTPHIDNLGNTSCEDSNEELLFISKLNPPPRMPPIFSPERARKERVIAEEKTKIKYMKYSRATVSLTSALFAPQHETVW
jgi:hypothetical protein